MADCVISAAAQYNAGLRLERLNQRLGRVSTDEFEPTARECLRIFNISESAVHRMSRELQAEDGEDA